MLVSCSIDNTVIVWRIPTADGEERPGGAILNPFQTLRQHTSFVKVLDFLWKSATAVV